MATGSISKVWKDSLNIYMAAAVTETINGKAVNVEYIGSVPLAELQGLSVAVQRSKLIEAVKKIRDENVSPITDVAISGSITL